jgi:hypothetical protein
MDSKRISVSLPQRKRMSADIVGARDLEEKAEQLENAMCDVRRTLAEMLPNARLIHAHFVSHRRNSIVFRSCRSWTEYCSKRLHCTPDAIFMAEKRMRIKEVIAEQAKEEKRLAKWAQSGEPPPGMMGHTLVSPYWRPASPPNEYPDDETDEIERVVPEYALTRALAAVDEATEVLTKIIGSGSLTPALLAEAKKCVAHTASVAGTVRKELGLDDGGKVVSIDRDVVQ